MRQPITEETGQMILEELRKLNAHKPEAKKKKSVVKIEQHYSVEQVAEKLGLGVSTIYAAVANSKIGYVVIGDRTYIPLSSIDEYIKSRTVKAKPRKTATTHE